MVLFFINGGFGLISDNNSSDDIETAQTSGDNSVVWGNGDASDDTNSSSSGGIETTQESVDNLTDVRVNPELNLLISVGHRTNYAIKNGMLYVWGSNDSGQLGTGSTDSHGVKTPVIVMQEVKTVSAGPDFIMVLKKDGTLWASGQDSYGQLGDGKASPDTGCYVISSDFVQIMADVKTVDASNGGGVETGHTLAVKNDGSLWVWGRNDNGQIGNGTTTRAVNKPVELSGINDVIAVAAGSFHSLALKADGTVWAWGLNDQGQVGNGTYEDQTKPVKILDDVKAVSAAGKCSAALKNDGTVLAWGSNTGGILGQGDTNAKNSAIPLFVPQLKDISIISISYLQMFAICGFR